MIWKFLDPVNEAFSKAVNKPKSFVLPSVQLEAPNICKIKNVEIKEEDIVLGTTLKQIK